MTTATAPTSAWKSLYFRADDGLMLHVRHIGNRAASGLPILCLPGLTRNVEDFEIIGRALAQTGKHWVVALDSRGRGGSDRDPDWKNYALPVELGDVVRLLDVLSIESAIFLGTSRGGLLTMLMGLVKPGIVAGAILNDIGPVIDIAGLMRIKGYVGKIAPPADFDAGAETLLMMFGGQFPNEDAASWMRFARRSWQQEGERLVPRYDAHIMNTLVEVTPETPMPDLWGPFDTLKGVPLMVIRGALSDLLSAETVAEMTARHGQTETLTVPAQGHAPLLEDEPTIGAIAAFISRCRAQNGGHVE